MLVLNTLRFGDEIRAMGEFDLPGSDLDALGVSERELTMAERLVDDMAEAWQPEQYHDTYREDLLKLIDRKVSAGETHLVAEPESKAGSDAGAEVVDLMALLKRSLEARGGKEEGATPSMPDKPPRKGGSHGEKDAGSDHGHEPHAPRRRRS
jgi:DNA end-binding protein Ku